MANNTTQACPECRSTNTVCRGSYVGKGLSCTCLECGHKWQATAQKKPDTESSLGKALSKGRTQA